MSMCRCDDCATLIDSDDDPYCFVEVTNMRRLTIDKIMCETCRYAAEQREEAERDAASRCEALSEQTTQPVR